MGQSKYPEILNDLNDRIHEYMYTYTPSGVCLCDE